MLWDVPILFRDLFDKLPGDVAVMEHLLASPPGKFSELKTNQLLTGYFRGVGVHQVETQGRNESVRNNGTRAFQP